MEADGIIDPHETDFLNDVITKFVLAESELGQTVEIDFNLVINEFKQFNNDKKLKSMELFIDMAECDGYVNPMKLKSSSQYSESKEYNEMEHQPIHRTDINEKKYD